MFSPATYPIAKALGYVSLGMSDLELASQAAEQILGLRRVDAGAGRNIFSSNGIGLTE
jgi:hypothetical protein